MQFIIEIIRKVVVLVLLMEVVLQLQSGKQYEPYIKMLIGIMVVYSLVSGIFGAWSNVETGILAPMQEFQWSGEWYMDLEEQAEEQVEEHTGQGQQEQRSRIGDVEVRVDVAPIANVVIEDVHIETKEPENLSESE